MCDICTNSFNKGGRTKITCPTCEFQSCKTCVRTYLVTTQSGPNPCCMNCHAVYPLKFLVTNLNRSWVLSGKYKDSRTGALLDVEMGKIPDTMQAAEAEKSRRLLEEQSRVFRKKIRLLEAEKIQYSNAIIANDYLQRGREPPGRFMTNLNDGAPVQYAKEDNKKKFIMACPSGECKGFLSTGYKCGLCENFTCSGCLAVLGKTKDEDHVCGEEDKASAELIKRETKSCPGCGERIFKISGCDQMFCVTCHCAFSWKTGQIETGTIHNPHFYEIQRQGGTITRNVGDVPCGGLLATQKAERILWRLGRVLCASDIHPELARLMSQTGTRMTAIHQNLAELQQYDLDRYRTIVRDHSKDTREMRVAFLLGDITKSELGPRVYQSDLRRQQSVDRLHIMELLHICGIETLRDIDESMDEDPRFKDLRHEWWAAATARRLHKTRRLDEEEEARLVPCMQELCLHVEERLKNLDRVREYCNGEMKELSMIYNCTVHEWDTRLNKGGGKKYTLKGELTGSKRNTKMALPPTPALGMPPAPAPPQLN